ncbi:MAG: hypothetical protein JO206_02415 [Solirubrobacterales bacterium]|nr:hypothetical protein [Solirubrobacterales bacterium]MBV9471795.1 hypothetical protein [Solirubrobacterales bacterium]MBV9838683.1 hypothetical protein [Solirubrobacterales bacterium]
MSETETPREEPAHDVLAAEAFAMPAPDPSLRHGPVRLPEDPTGIEEPHDVLAAEEFAMPAPPARAGAWEGKPRRRAGLALGGGAAALFTVRALLRALRRR